MINVQAVVLNLLLSCTDKELALSCFDKIKPQFFSSSFGTIHKAITQYYSDHHVIPSLDELSIKFSRSSNLQLALATLRNLDSLDIDLDMAIDALRDEYAQQAALDMISVQLLDNIQMMPSEEIPGVLSRMAMDLEMMVDMGGAIHTSGEIELFPSPDNTDMEMIHTGISNVLDHKFGGAGREELILLGGGMGSGKSILCANMCVAQWRMGNIAPYFTVEMNARETFLRMMAIIAGVDGMKTKQGTLDGDELLKLALARAKMFYGGAEVYTKFVEGKEELSFTDFHEMDLDLRNNHEEIHPLVIIDERILRLSTIDMHLTKLVSEYGKKLTFAVIDYLNVVRLDTTTGDSELDWKYQVKIAEELKALARKYKIPVMSPYQTNEDGTARFSKAILVPVDMALVLNGDKEAGLIEFETIKVRSLPPVKFNVGMDWRTLSVNPEPVTELEAENNTAASKEAKIRDETGETSFDV